MNAKVAKNREPLVSVILTSYNYAQYVKQAIDSVFDQTYSNVELIVVDDGSKDESRDVIAECVRSPKIPVRTIFKENGGQSSAFNAALEVAGGSLVAFIDSDDAWRPEKLRSMVDLAFQCPNGGVYQHQVEVGFDGPRRLEYILSGDVFSGWKQIGPRVNLAIHQGRISPFVPTVGLMFGREVLNKVLPIPTRLVTCPDAYLTRTCAAHGPLYSHPGILATWRDHPENAGKSEAMSYHSYWLKTIMPVLNEYYRDNSIPLEFYYQKPELGEAGTEKSGDEIAGRGWISRLFGKS